MGPGRAAAPGALRPEPLRCPGQLQGRDHPPMVDLLALAFRSTSHRPSCRFGSAGDAALSARSPVARPVAVRRRHAARTNPLAPAGAGVSTADPQPVGVAASTPAGCPTSRDARRTGRPPELARWCPSRTGSADVGLAEAWSRTVLRRANLPKVVSPRLESPAPVGVALPGTRVSVQHASHQVKGYFRMHRVLPRTSGLHTENASNSTARAQVHPQGRAAGRTASLERRDDRLRRGLDGPLACPP